MKGYVLCKTPVKVRGLWKTLGQRGYTEQTVILNSNAISKNQLYLLVEPLSLLRRRNHLVRSQRWRRTLGSTTLVSSTTSCLLVSRVACLRTANQFV